MCKFKQVRAVKMLNNESIDNKLGKADQDNLTGYVPFYLWAYLVLGLVFSEAFGDLVTKYVPFLITVYEFTRSIAGIILLSVVLTIYASLRHKWTISLPHAIFSAITATIGYFIGYFCIILLIHYFMLGKEQIFEAIFKNEHKILLDLFELFAQYFVLSLAGIYLTNKIIVTITKPIKKSRAKKKIENCD